MNYITVEKSERRGFIKLLEIKDSDIRMSILRQGNTAADKGIHSGGAFSAVIPMVALYYGGFMNFDPEQPTSPGQDLFVLSKGHAVATLASIYADIGFIESRLLVNSRSGASTLNGHPGPLLPGVHIPTGPMGQGICVAGGFALRGKESPNFDVFTLTGDGELQEGTVWEAVLFSGAKRLDNLCVIVDKNLGQLDNPMQNSFPMGNTAKQFEGFGFRVFDVDGTQYGEFIEALNVFKYGVRDGRPTAIISNTTKGFGSFAGEIVKHKITLDNELARRELRLQEDRRHDREAEFIEITRSMTDCPGGKEGLFKIGNVAGNMNLTIDEANRRVLPVPPVVRIKRAKPRDKRIVYDAHRLPIFEATGEYAASEMIREAMKVFAEDRRIVSIDSDLGTTSGLEAGVGFVDRTRAINVGIAEANMMCIGEAYAVLGYNVWVSTFCPFFNLNVLRRTAINQQERMEVVAGEFGWLTEGHTLDITYLATASNFDTRVNGATHMGNDDMMLVNNIGHIRIIDISCPNQLLGLMKWVMEGGKGLLYVRIMRAPSAVLYDPGFVFEFGRGYILQDSENPRAALVSSGRGVHEILKAGQILMNQGIPVQIVDMPSADEEMFIGFLDSGIPVIFAEQNNGYLSMEYRSLMSRKGISIDHSLIRSINTLDTAGRPRYIHSAIYSELLDVHGLTPEKISEEVRRII